jgi:hypothetical protein
MPAGARANSRASLALRSLSGLGRKSSPVVLQKVESVQQRLAGLVAAVQGLEDGNTVVTDHHDLAVHGE